MFFLYIKHAIYNLNDELKQLLQKWRWQKIQKI